MTPNFTHALVTFDNWQRAQAKPIPYRLATLATMLGTDARTLARCLRVSGWKRDRVRFTRHRKRILETWWLPPGCRPMKRRRRGRPSYIEILNP